MRKECKVCKKIYPNTSFSPIRKGGGRRYNACIDCMKINNETKKAAKKTCRSCRKSKCCSEFVVRHQENRVITLSGSCKVCIEEKQQSKTFLR